MLKFLYEFVHTGMPLLEKAAIFFSPVINVDGVQFLETEFQRTGKLPWIRKNKRPMTCQEGVEYEAGVDLNRNYGYSSPLDQCEKTYGGPFPFSEPETQSVKNFIQTYNNIKLAVNIHAYGNYICIPFLADDAENTKLESYPSARTFYDKLRERENRPMMGNVAQITGQQAPGTASDWMLEEMNVIAITVELGTNSTESEAFFLERSEIDRVITENYPWMVYAFDEIVK